MTKNILIDAVHPEEIRVAMENNGRLEEFDFESESKQQIKSNIYLGKVTRVEPSLQAVFVEYGGNRQGFLPFSEIHYDYYQIPVADREKLEAELEEIDRQAEEAEKLRAKAEEEREANKARSKSKSSNHDEDEDWEDDGNDTPAMPASKKDDEASTTVKIDDAEKPKRKRGRPKKAETEKKDEADAKAAESEEKPKRGRPKKAETEKKDQADAKASESEEKPKPKRGRPKKAETEKKDEAEAEGSKSESSQDKDKKAARSKAKRAGTPKPAKESTPSDSSPATPDDYEPDENEPGIVEEAVEARHIGRSSLYRNYKVQEVIKRGQLMLVQVIKEERGNKGASLTTYVSLAGRYCVLMPNTERAGGVSRRIQDYSERKRLKTIVNGLEMAKGSSLIVRTAGIGQDQKSIERDYDYLSKLWNEIKQSAVSSEAPALVHEEGNIIKRVLRDMYRDDVENIYVQGGKAFDATKKFLQIMAPDDMNKLEEYKDSEPIFKHFGISEELEQLYHNEAPLSSGGSIVIVQTEALVAIDVNSGKATSERSIESTALNTNLEAAKEIARQLRLRDLAGLVVIDFIDMREIKNRRSVEKALKEALREDRAKIQVGRISMFGLMEMSRQRLRSSIVESSTRVCPSCSGTGYIRSEQSIALSVLRAIENEAAWGTQNTIHVNVPVDMAIYLLNEERKELSAIEERFGVTIVVQHDFSMSGTDFEVEKPRVRRRDRSNNRKRVGNDNRKRGPKHQEQKQTKKHQAKQVDEPKEKTDHTGENTDEDHKRKSSSRSTTTPANDANGKKDHNDTAKKSAPPQQEQSPEAASQEEEPRYEQDDSKLKGLWRRITQ